MVEKHPIRAAIDDIVKQTPLNPKSFAGQVLRDEEGNETGYNIQIMAGNQVTLPADSYGELTGNPEAMYQVLHTLVAELGVMLVKVLKALEHWEQKNHRIIVPKDARPQPKLRLVRNDADETSKTEGQA